MSNNSSETSGQWCGLVQDGCAATETTMLGWVPYPQYRGTISIVWTCLFVIFTCTWTVMHINVPAPRETKLAVILRKARWAMFIMYAPEAVTLLAACQWQSARASRKAMRDIGVAHWTRTHGFFADSGGYVLVSPDAPPFPVNSRAILYLVRKGYLAAPQTTEAELWDKSKSDHFAKAAAAIQMTHLFCQVVTRLAQHIETSCLEIVTVAFCICALATSAFWLGKPKDVTCPIMIELKTSLAQVLHEAGPEIAGKPWHDTPMDFVEQPGWTVWNRREAFRAFGGLEERPLQRIPNDYITPPDTISLALVTWAITVAHPAIHMLEWNFEFPTAWEKVIWQVSCASLLAILFVWGLVEVLSVKPGVNFRLTLLGIWVKETTRLDSWWRTRAMDLPGAISSLLYFFARTALLIESFASLRRMPLSVYQTVGLAQYLPHFS